MIILGIDPGLQKTGWGVIRKQGNKLKFLGSGLIKTHIKAALPERLSLIHTELCTVIQRYEPQTAAVEETFVNKNPASALKLGQARGVALAVPAIHGIPTSEYGANKIKKSVVGVGHAGKQQIAVMIGMLLPTSGSVSSDEADALAVAICHAHHCTVLTKAVCL